MLSLKLTFFDVVNLSWRFDRTLYEAILFIFTCKYLSLKLLQWSKRSRNPSLSRKAITQHWTVNCLAESPHPSSSGLKMAVCYRTVPGQATLYKRWRGSTPERTTVLPQMKLEQTPPVSMSDVSKLIIMYHALTWVVLVSCRLRFLPSLHRGLHYRDSFQ